MYLDLVCLLPFGMCHDLHVVTAVMLFGLCDDFCVRHRVTCIPGTSLDRACLYLTELVCDPNIHVVATASSVQSDSRSN